MWTFKGGVHPSDHKYTSNIAITNLPIPKKIVIPIHQHIGAPSTPLVKVGDIVKTGQKIAEANGFVSANIHSSISGKVTAIKNSRTILGTFTQNIFIEGDGSDDLENFDTKYSEYYRYEPKELVNHIKEQGIVGLGGAAFPTHVKLSPPENKIIDTIIANGAECEPYLTTDTRLMIEEPKKIIEGINILMHILNADKTIIVIEDNKPIAIQAMQNELIKHPNINLFIAKTHYPQGAEKQLIYSVTKRKVPPKALPMDVGCIVENVATLAAIRDAVIKSMPQIERVVTITGDNLYKPCNVRARMGVSIRELLEFAGWNTIAKKIIAGGPMMGIAQSSIDVPIMKATSGILVFDEKSCKSNEESDCIRCGKCLEVCPMNLVPTMIQRCTRYDLWDEIEKFNIIDCIECGSCAYACPAKIPLVQSIKIAKFKARQKK